MPERRNQRIYAIDCAMAAANDVFLQFAILIGFRVASASIALMRIPPRIQILASALAVNLHCCLEKPEQLCERVADDPNTCYSSRLSPQQCEYRFVPK